MRYVNPSSGHTPASWTRVGVPIRIVIIKNIVAPYTIPIFTDLAARDGVEVLVVYERLIEANRLWRVPAELPYRYVVLNALSINLPRVAPDTYIHLPWRPLHEIVRFRPDVVVASGGVWNSPANIAAKLMKQRYGWRFVPWWGQFLTDTDGPRSRAGIDRVKAWFVRSSEGWLADSSRAELDLVRLGADPARIVRVPFVAVPRPPVAVHHRPVKAPRERRFLFVGQLTRRKGIDVLLRAFASVEGAELWIAGDGPLRAEVIAAADADPRITWFGFLDRARLEEIYAAADVVVVPSRYEHWGLVVNEALTQGLPVVLSGRVGAADLVQPGVTGLIAADGTQDTFRDALIQVQHWSQAQCDRCQTQARHDVNAYTPHAAATAVLAACSLATQP